MSKRRLLFTSYHFPPSRAARSLQLGKLTNALLKRGHQIDVVTVKTEDVRDPLDQPAPEWLMHDGLCVTRVASPPRSGADWFWAALAGQNFPGWRRSAAREAVRTARSADYAAIVSFAMPIDSAFVGFAVKKAVPRLPWIAHFSDPWAWNPYVGAKGIRQRVLDYLESKLCARADRVIGVSDELTALFARGRTANSNKFLTLQHVFDPEQYPKDAPPADGPLMLRYLGGFSPRRRPDPLLNALRGARDRGARLNGLRIELIGGGMEDVAAQLNEIQPGIATAPGQVSFRESLRLMCTAHALLLIDADEAISPFFPSKLADYFGSRRPIIAVTPGHSCSARLIRQVGGACFEHRETDRLTDLLAKLADHGAAALPQIHQAAISQFEADHAAVEFERIIQSL